MNFHKFVIFIHKVGNQEVFNLCKCDCNKEWSTHPHAHTSNHINTAGSVTIITAPWGLHLIDTLVTMVTFVWQWSSGTIEHWTFHPYVIFVSITMTKWKAFNFFEGSVCACACVCVVNSQLINFDTETLGSNGGQVLKISEGFNRK